MKRTLPLAVLVCCCSASVATTAGAHVETAGNHAPVDRPKPEAFVQSFTMTGCLNPSFDGLWNIQQSPSAPADGDFTKVMEGSELGFPSYVTMSLYYLNFSLQRSHCNVALTSDISGTLTKQIRSF